MPQADENAAPSPEDEDGEDAANEIVRERACRIQKYKQELADRGVEELDEGHENLIQRCVDLELEQLGKGPLVKSLRCTWVTDGGGKCAESFGQPFVEKESAPGSPRTKKRRHRLNRTALWFIKSRDQEELGKATGKRLIAETHEYVNYVHGGVVASNLKKEGLISGYLEEVPVLRAIDLNPAKINLGALDVLFKTQPKRTIVGQHERDGPIPSSSGLSKLRRKLNARGVDLFGIKFDDISAAEEEGWNDEADDDDNESPEKLGNAWKFEDVKRFIQALLEAFKVRNSMHASRVATPTGSHDVMRVCCPLRPIVFSHSRNTASS